MKSRTRHALPILIATILGLAVCFVVIRRALGAESPLLGLLLMLDFLALSKVAEPFLRLRMPELLRPLRAWERSGMIYRRLGVRAFGRMLRGTRLRYLNTSVYLSHGQADPQHVLLLAGSAEASHFFAALVFVPFIALAFANEQYVTGNVFVVLQLLLNVYPILHLRLVRGRLDRYLIARERAPTP